MFKETKHKIFVCSAVSVLIQTSLGNKQPVILKLWSTRSTSLIGLAKKEGNALSETIYSVCLQQHKYLTTLKALLCYEGGVDIHQRYNFLAFFKKNVILLSTNVLHYECYLWQTKISNLAILITYPFRSSAIGKQEFKPKYAKKYDIFNKKS